LQTFGLQDSKDVIRNEISNEVKVEIAALNPRNASPAVAFQATSFLIIYSLNGQRMKSTISFRISSGSSSEIRKSHAETRDGKRLDHRACQIARSPDRDHPTSQLLCHHGLGRALGSCTAKLCCHTNPRSNRK
jgi:hypothetical protein